MTKRSTRTLGLVIFGVLVIALSATGLALARGPAATVECPPAKASRAASVLVDTPSHTLVLCENGQPVERFGVRLGKGGTGKSREGDGKTPLGRYPLSDPQPSASFGTFIPVGYPTPEQRKLGYTGSAIGVHGPGRGVRWLGRFVNTFDLSDGCIGLATDAETKRIADWVKSRQAYEIVLR